MKNNCKMAKSKANARLLVQHEFLYNGLKVYGKPMNYPPVEVGDLGLVD
jgi:hypothetical protein